MKSAQVVMKGISPLLMHHFPMVPIEALEKRSPQEQAEYAAYRDPDTDFLYVPAINIQRALVGAAAYSKGKGRASLQKQSAACLQVSPERISLGVKDYIIDSRPVVVPATKGRILRHRPRLDKWEIGFDLEWDETLLKETEVRRIVDDMGQRVGLLDFRPERKGPFGRCVVVSWKLL
jgi:hypothetical protein